MITARRMREDFWSFAPTHKLWLATNHRPRIKGTDEAIWRRIRLIPFSVQFHEPGEGNPERDKDLPETLKSELEGILAWAVQGCLEWQEQGLGTAPEITAATESYRAEEDVFALFLVDCTVNRHGAEAKAKDLYARYVQWCENSGERPMSRKAFGDALRELFNAGEIHIRIQEVRERGHKIYYITRDGAEGEFTFKTLSNLISKYRNSGS